MRAKEREKRRAKKNSVVVCHAWQPRRVYSRSSRTTVPLTSRKSCVLTSSSPSSTPLPSFHLFTSSPHILMSRVTDKHVDEEDASRLRFGSSESHSPLNKSNNAMRTASSTRRGRRDEGI